MDWAHQRITAALTKAQVEKSPDIDTEKPVSRQHETTYYGYYGYTPYWAGAYLWGAYPYPYLGSGPALSAADLERERRWNWEAKEREDPHLRSARAVTGYHIQATDGDIGHVEDFLVDDHSWAIRYMLVDTTNWWAGKKVLVAPAWIERVDWAESKVHVTVTRAQITDQSRVRSRPAGGARLRDATVRPLWGTPLLARVAQHGRLSGPARPDRAGTRGGVADKGETDPPRGERLCVRGAWGPAARRPGPPGRAGARAPALFPSSGGDEQGGRSSVRDAGRREEGGHAENDRGDTDTACGFHTAPLS